MTKNNLDLELLKHLKSAVILPHTSPDGDTIGSSVALALALNSIGVETRIVIDDEMPDDIAFLAEGRMTSLEQLEAKKFVYNTCICVDMSSVERLAERKFLLRGKTVINIDHHKSNEYYGDYNYVELRPATAEIIYEILKSLEIEITAEIAEAIYLGIVTDTGGFKYRSVTADTFKIASELMQINFDREKVNFHLNHNRSLAKVRLHSAVIGETIYYQKGRVALAIVTEAMLEKYNAKYSDSDGIVESIRDIAGVEVVFLIKEKGERELKISMRSIGDIDVSKIAVKHHGGGHQNAGGFSLEMSVDEAKRYFEEQIFPNV